MKTLNAALIFRFVDRLSAPARAAARTIGNVERAQKMAARASEQWSRGLDDLDTKMGRLANASLVTEGLDRAGRAMSRPLFAATQNAATFERGMTGIGITAQLTDRQLIPLRDNIMQTASDLGALPATIQATYGAVLAEGVFRTEQELSQAGRSVARFQKLAETMGDPISNAEAGALSSAFGGSYRIASNMLDRANAMVSRSAQLGGVGIGSVARVLPQQSGALVGLKFANEQGLADLLAANQIAKRLAGTSEEATNNITNLMAGLASPEVRRRFGEVGIDLEREIKRGIERGVSPLETLATVTSQQTRGDQFKIADLFGDRQARDGLMALVQNLDDFRAMSDQIGGQDALPAYLRDLDRASSGTSGSFDRYTASMSRASIATGSILAPAAGWAAGLVERLAGWMARAEESGNPLARAAVVVAAGLAASAVAAGAVGNAVIGIIGPWLIMRSVFGTLGGAAVKAGFARIAMGIGMARNAVLGFNLAMLANPVGLVVAGIVAAVAIVALVVRKYWQPISAFFVGFGRGMAEAFAPIGAALAPLKPVWDGIVGGVSAVWGWITRLLTPVRMTSQQLAGATSAGQSFGRIVGGAITGLFSPIIRFAQLVGFVVRNWSSITGAFVSIFGQVGAFFSGLPARFMAFGSNIIDGLVNGIRNGISRVAGAAAEAGRAAASAAGNAMGNRSASRVFSRLGDYTMQGLALGVNRSRGLPIARVAAVAAALAGAAPDMTMAMASAGGAVDASAGRSAAAPVSRTLNQYFTVNGANMSVRELARELKRLGDAGARGDLGDGGEA